MILSGDWDGLVIDAIGRDCIIWSRFQLVRCVTGISRRLMSAIFFFSVFHTKIQSWNSVPWELLVVEGAVSLFVDHLSVLSSCLEMLSAINLLISFLH